MCGLTGFWQDPAPRDDMERIARSMADRIAHRGPDDSGVWADERTGLVLAHRRLSIVDLSAAGHQPMLSASARHVLAYNGEAYNHLDLRRDLEASGAAPAWRGHSDTETLLACIEGREVAAVTLGSAVRRDSSGRVIPGPDQRYADIRRLLTLLRDGGPLEGRRAGV